MSGYQFIHYEVYARQCPAKSKKDGRTAAEVLDENDRKPGNMPHVKNPRDPQLLYGVSVDEVRKMHDEVENATTTLKNGRTRKIRKTQNTLATGVASYPVPWSEIRGNKAEKEKLKSWLRDTVGFQKREWGDDLKSAILHTDEKFPHIHFLGLRNDWDAGMLHPGLAAAKGKTGKEAAKAAGDALIAIQDKYAAEVAEKYGQCRIGPKPHKRLRQKRLTRREWIEKQNKQDGLARLVRREKEEVEKIKNTVAAEWAEKSLAGKIAVSKKAVPAVQIEEAKAEERVKVSAEYGKRIDQEEARRVEAVGAERKKANAAKKELAVFREKFDALSALNTNLTASLDDANKHVALVDYTMSENVKALHRKARLTNSEADYVVLSGACENVANIRKSVGPNVFQNAWHDVKQVVVDVSQRVPAIFKKVFGWAIPKQPAHEKQSPARESAVNANARGPRGPGMGM